MRPLPLLSEDEERVLVKWTTDSSMRPLPVLSEDEEQILVKWTTDSSRKGFPQRKLVVLLSVKEFLTVNQRKTPGNGWLQAFLCAYPELSTCTSDSITSSSIATLGDADNSYLLLCTF
jgi:hypothetical protein